MSNKTPEDVASKAGLSAEDINEQIEEDFVEILANKVEPWKLAFYCVLGIIDVDAIDKELDGRSEQEKRIKAIHEFKMKYNDRATYRVLVQAVLANDKADDAQEMCSALWRCRGNLTNYSM